MASHNRRKREDNGPSRARHPPLVRDDRSRTDDHANNDERRDDEGHSESLEDGRDLLPEVGALDLLLRRGPGHVVREQVREHGLGNRDRETTEEEEAARASAAVSQRSQGARYAQERDPADVLKERPEKTALPETVLEEREADVAGAEEDNGGGNPDLERVHVEAVNRELEAEEDVVDDTDRRRGRDTVCTGWSARCRMSTTGR
jgi:hypothetical protein